MAWIGALIGLAGTAFSASQSRSSAADANTANTNLNERNIAWQTEMSNTAVQRRAADMKAAGINPILAAGAPASQPSASMIPMQPEKGQSAQFINQAASNAAAIANVMADTEKKKAEAKNVAANTPLNINQGITAGVSDAQMQLRTSWVNAEKQGTIIDQQLTNLKQELEKLKADTSSAQTAAANANALQRATIAAQEIGNQLMQLKQPEAAAAAKLWQEIGSGGKTLNYLSEAVLMLKNIFGK